MQKSGVSYSEILAQRVPSLPCEILGTQAESVGR
jgi:hypothetical protein